MKKALLIFSAFSFLTVLLLMKNWLYPGNTVTEYVKMERKCRDVKDPFCRKHFIVSVISKDGLTAGLKILNDKYLAEPGFRPNCHPFAIGIGVDLASTTPDYTKFSYTPESVWCNFGFYQGYPASLLLTTGSVEKARSFCEYVGARLLSSVPDVKAECFRGIGRGLPFLKKEYAGDAVRMADFATRTCNKITTEKAERGLCLHGAFNALGRAAVDEIYGLSVNITNPLWLCTEQTESIKPFCYGNFKWTAISLINGKGDLSAQLQAFENISANMPDMVIQQIIETLAYDEARKSVTKQGADASAIQSCATLPSVYVPDCIWGFAYGLAKHGTPDAQHLQVIAFCNQARQIIPSLKKEVCPSQAIRYLRGFYSPTRFKNACEDFKKELGVSCE